MPEISGALRKRPPPDETNKAASVLLNASMATAASSGSIFAALYKIVARFTPEKTELKRSATAADNHNNAAFQPWHCSRSVFP